MWRPEDDALLERLSDEALLPAVWAQAAPGAPPLHRNAAGMLSRLRALARASGRDAPTEPRHYLELATPPSLQGLSAELVHHLALFHRARVAHWIGRPRASPEDLERSLLLVLGCWLFLAHEKEYLRSLATEVIGSGGRSAVAEQELEAAVDGALLRGIDAVAGEAARSEAERSPSRALAALARIEEAVKLAGVPEALARRARAHAIAHRARLVNDLVTPLTLELDALAAREWKPEELLACFERARSAWRWAGEEPELERLVVRELPRFAWDLYRERRWNDMRSILAPLEPMTDRMARRIESDPAELAWASQCAQVLVFRAELAPSLNAQIALAERGHRLCPTLRNGRLVLADLLCARAERKLDQPGLWKSGDAKAAAQDVARAEQLYPELRRLPALRQRLAKGAA